MRQCTGTACGFLLVAKVAKQRVKSINKSKKKVDTQSNAGKNTKGSLSLPTFSVSVGAKAFLTLVPPKIRDFSVMKLYKQVLAF